MLEAPRSGSCSHSRPQLNFQFSPMKTPFADALRELAATAERVVVELGPEMDRALEMVQDAVSRRGTLFFCGNGGSAADAQHMATEYVIRYMRNRRAYPAIAL